MKKIKLSDDESYVNIIKETIKNFDSYEFMSDKIDMIVDKIDSDINYIILDNEDIYIKLYIYLNDVCYYGINYDFKNFPILSFGCRELVIHNSDTIIGIDENLIINLCEIDIKNFEKIQ